MYSRDLSTGTGTNAGTIYLQPDTAGDGLLDDWELPHGFNLLDAQDAPADADHDGQSNLAEFRAGTNPTNQ